jgi:predicted nucleotidyltransferase
MIHWVPSGDGRAEAHAITKAVPLTETFLNTLVAELDNDDIVGITLGGSYVRGEATPYSDVDIACFVKDEVKPHPKRFLYRDNLLVSIGTKTVAGVRNDLLKPESAILIVSGLRRILLDKDGTVTRLVQEIEAFTWEPLQNTANSYASFRMMTLAERVHKVLSELLKRDELALAYVASELVYALTEVVAVQRGVFVKSESTYYWQVQAAVGLDSDWTVCHRWAIGVDSVPTKGSLVLTQAIAALRLYQETVKLLRSVLHQDHLAVAEQAVRVIDEAVPYLGL